MGIFDRFKDWLGKEESIQEQMNACDRCGFEYPQTSLIGSNGMYFCFDCNEKRKKDTIAADLKAKQAAALANAKTKFFCYNCKFHFSRKKDFGVRICPNCGSENFVEENRLI